jgi:signal transduction histidine kinase
LQRLRSTQRGDWRWPGDELGEPAEVLRNRGQRELELGTCPISDRAFPKTAEGMGMGLSIARTIIEAHSGLISAKNRDHGGASFRIRLPLCTDGAGPS